MKNIFLIVIIVLAIGLAIAISILENADTMGERMGRIRRIKTDFFGIFCLKSVHWGKKIRFHPPNPPHPFSHCIAFYQNAPIFNWVYSELKLL